MNKNELTDPLLKKLYGRLSDIIDDRANVLISGGALIQGHAGIVDAANTAMSYNGDVKYIRALQDVLDIIIDIDRDQYGRKSDNGD